MKRFNLENIPETEKPRIIIIGAGFGGLKLMWSLAGKGFQIVLIDRHNYHQFQPLFYQVATAGLEPSSISFPLRKVFHKKKDVHIRMAELLKVESSESYVETSLGKISYDHLVIATGVTTNFFGNANIEKNSLPMKSVGEALFLRNKILSNFEKAINEMDEALRRSLLNIVVVGGGPTGVEVSGALSEMRKYVLPVDFPELDFNQMTISLLEAGPKLLPGMSEASSRKAEDYLKKLGVQVKTQALVEDYDGEMVRVKDSEDLHSKTLIWAAGVKGINIHGLEGSFSSRGRFLVDRFNRLQGKENIYALGDIAQMAEGTYSEGHPQVAQVAIQQANLLAKNLRTKKGWKEFSYKDLGSMATVGRNLAVADLPFMRFQGFLAWVFWLAVHLAQILGVKNKVFIFLNWAWSYLTFDQSLRLILRQGDK